MRQTIYATVLAAIVFATAIFSVGQSGGGFEITDAVIGSGGSLSTAPGFELDSVVGQAVDGSPSIAGPFAVTSGFWTFTPLAPTAAHANISGRVLRTDGSGVSGAVLYLQTPAGDIYVARSGSFGYYQFTGIEVGQAVFITVEHKSFNFEPRTLMLVDDVADVDFIPQP